MKKITLIFIVILCLLVSGLSAQEKQYTKQENLSQFDSDYYINLRDSLMASLIEDINTNTNFVKRNIDFVRIQSIEVLPDSTKNRLEPITVAILAGAGIYGTVESVIYTIENWYDWDAAECAGEFTGGALKGAAHVAVAIFGAGFLTQVWNLGAGNIYDLVADKIGDLAGEYVFDPVFNYIQSCWEATWSNIQQGFDDNYNSIYNSFSFFEDLEDEHGNVWAPNYSDQWVNFRTVPPQGLNIGGTLYYMDYVENYYWYMYDADDSRIELSFNIDDLSKGMILSINHQSIGYGPIDITINGKYLEDNFTEHCYSNYMVSTEWQIIEFINLGPNTMEIRFGDDPEYTYRITNLTIIPGATDDPLPEILSGYPQYDNNILLGDWAEIKVQVKNIGYAAKDGGIVISFPEMQDESDKDNVYCVTSETSSDLEYHEWAIGDLGVWHRDFGDGPYQDDAEYLKVEAYEFGENYPWLFNETNTITIKVKPEQTGQFHFYVRSAMARYFNEDIAQFYFNDPYCSTGYIDQQGWEVNRYTITVTGQGSPPVADFVGDPISGSAPLTVQFTDQSTNNTTSWSWYLGEGNACHEQNPSHTYENAGSYDLVLCATNQYGYDYEIKTDYITVTEGNPPLADFVGSPRSGDAPLTVQFTDQSSNNPTFWSWSFGDGNTINQQNPSHTYENTGSYNVTFVALNQYGYDTELKVDYINVIDSNDLDLITISMNASPIDIIAGTETTASCEVKNQGNGSADSSILKYYLSSDTVYSSNDTELGSDEVGILSSGGTSPENEHLTIPQGTSAGTWYILFYADATQQVDESDENNNVGYKQIAVYPFDSLIWPGDTDYSGTVNEVDIDFIAINWGKTGDPRSSISFEWVGCDYPGNWTEPFAALSDCNGDGIVNIADALAICLNWDKTHSVSLKHLDTPDNLEEYRDNFVRIYNSLDDSEIEIKIKNHIAEMFDLPIIEIVRGNNLMQNFPNPFSETTKISFDLKEDETFSIIKIWNIKGQLVKQIETGNVQYDSNTVEWKGKDQKGMELPNGIYFYQVETNDWKSKINKMILMR